MIRLQITLCDSNILHPLPVKHANYDQPESVNKMFSTKFSGKNLSAHTRMQSVQANAYGSGNKPQFLLKGDSGLNEWSA